jgi:lipopolysaccharide transport protein LptA
MELYRNVVITQDDLELKADYSIISFLEKERLVKKIYAKGNVEIYQQNNKTGVKSSSYSKEASYNPLSRILTLEGDVKLIKDGNVMESTHIRYDLNSESVSADQVNGVIKLRNKEKIHDRGK